MTDQVDGELANPLIPLPRIESMEAGGQAFQPVVIMGEQGNDVAIGMRSSHWRDSLRAVEVENRVPAPAIS
jgi:hypothetical protein